MRTALLIVFAASFAVFSTLLLLVDNDKLKYGGLLAFIVMMALAFRKSGLPWWVASLMFGLTGACHLIAPWALYPHAHAAGAVPAFESFGPGYLVMGALSMCAIAGSAELGPSYFGDPRQSALIRGQKL